MKMFVAIANKIYEIDRLRNARIIYTGPENMTMLCMLIIIIVINYFILLIHMLIK